MPELDGEPVFEITEKDGKQRLNASWPVYTPQERIGDAWLPIADKQHNLWTACMIAAATFWKAHPETPIGCLEESVSAAVRTLRETDVRIAWIGDREHLVRKTIYVFDVALDELPTAVRRMVFPIRATRGSRSAKLGRATRGPRGAFCRECQGSGGVGRINL